MSNDTNAPFETQSQIAFARLPWKRRPVMATENPSFPMGKGLLYGCP
jgi:hypothetical protein